LLPTRQRETTLTSNPLEMTPERQARIRERAYKLWEEGGRPEGRDGEFWERAEELIGMEENADAALLPNPMTHPTRAEEPVEEAEIQENYGEFPTRFTDQGDRQQTPRPRSGEEE
jgi:hypothetical protein